jgi:FkbM family methyltransferase
MLNESAMTKVDTRYGEMFVLSADSVVSMSLVQYGEWAEGEIDVSKFFIPDGGIVLDIGAFIGSHARAYSQLVGPKGCVYAFEPRSEIFEILQLNAAISDFNNIISHQVAIADFSGEFMTHSIDIDSIENFGALSLKINERNPGNSIVKTICVDDLSIERLDFIKIDVEGMEAQVLHGARNSIARTSPVILCECNSIKGGAQILEIAKEMNYYCFGILFSAFNEDNFKKNNHNIFEHAKEVSFLLFSRNDKHALQVVNGNESWMQIETADDVAGILLHKPQYATEVLKNTSTIGTLGHFYSSQLSESQRVLIQSLQIEVRRHTAEIYRLKATFSWQITIPIRALYNISLKLWTRFLSNLRPNR